MVPGIRGTGVPPYVSVPGRWPGCQIGRAYYGVNVPSVSKAVGKLVECPLTENSMEPCTVMEVDPILLKEHMLRRRDVGATRSTTSQGMQPRFVGRRVQADYSVGVG